MKTKLFIDGKEGTTGLQIVERLTGREDIFLLTLSDAERKDAERRRECILESDITILCLPDAAAIEAVAFAEGGNTRIIDASTAHRTDSRFVYGFPELKPLRERIRESGRVAVPGCYASGFLSIVYPLVTLGLLPKNYPFVAFAVSGYSGGGKGMIAQYQAENRDWRLASPRQYALSQTHKHLKEMQGIAGLERSPLFHPFVADYYSGMEVSLSFYADLSHGLTKGGVMDALTDYYQAESFIKVRAVEAEESFLASNHMQGRNDMEIVVGGNDDRILITSVFDNLGKGASGAAVQCMNLMLGQAETKGLL